MENWLEYGHAPAEIVARNGVWPTPRHRYTLVTTARWETRYILEWISYHLSIGFDHIVIYCNDDSPKELFDAVLPFTLGPNPTVTFRHYGVTGAQFQMFFHYLRNFSTQTEWFMFLDVDEFLCLRGVDDIGRFLEGYSNIDALYFNWSFFGHNGHVTRPAGSVLRNYTRREPGATPFTKILVRSRAVPYAAVFNNPHHAIHHDIASLSREMRACNVLHDDMHGYYDDFPEVAWSYLKDGARNEKIVEIAFVAHFNIKSEQDFELRARRGTSGNFGGQGQWRSMSREERDRFFQLTNAVEDNYLAQYWERATDPRPLCVFPLPTAQLVSEGCAATQSSAFSGGDVEEEAEKLLSGQIGNFPASHTAVEDNPWWRVDLDIRCQIHEIRLFNRLDAAIDRVANVIISVSDDDSVWTDIHYKTDGVSYGGADGTPYIWQPDTPISARYVKVTVPGTQTYLNFSQIQIYGDH